MEISGYLSAILIGVSLGLIGGGGSILTVPVMVYLLGISPVLATAYSLFVVGLTSLVGAFNYTKRGLVSYKTALVFSIPSLIAVFFTRRYLMPALPENLFNIGMLSISKDMFIMLLFALLMIAVFITMVKNVKFSIKNGSGKLSFNYPLIFIEGLVVGVLTGFVGAGGGFLIIPSLVVLAKLPMRLAVGTSLLIIAVKSLVGFLGDIGRQQLDWTFLIMFTAFAVIGIFIGGSLSGKVSAEKLRQGFGYFVLCMGVFIIIKEMLLHYY